MGSYFGPLVAVKQGGSYGSKHNYQTLVSAACPLQITCGHFTLPAPSGAPRHIDHISHTWSDFLNIRLFLTKETILLFVFFKSLDSSPFPLGDQFISNSSHPLNKSLKSNTNLQCAGNTLD